MVTPEQKQGFARRLLGLMAGQGISSQRELAEKASITPDAASRYCTGRSIPRHAQLMNLCKALGCTEEDLLPPAGEPVEPVEFIKTEHEPDGRLLVTMRRRMRKETFAKVMQAVDSDGEG
jgi:transcriptional regulator with XRE-family HTH domain